MLVVGQPRLALQLAAVEAKQVDAAVVRAAGQPAGQRGRWGEVLIVDSTIIVMAIVMAFPLASSLPYLSDPWSRNLTALALVSFIGRKKDVSGVKAASRFKLAADHSRTVPSYELDAKRLAAICSPAGTSTSSEVTEDLCSNVWEIIMPRGFQMRPGHARGRSRDVRSGMESIKGEARRLSRASTYSPGGPLPLLLLLLLLL